MKFEKLCLGLKQSLSSHRIFAWTNRPGGGG